MKRKPSPKQDYACSQCSQVNTGPRIPLGWKEVSGCFYCKDCFASGFVCRACELPVSAPLESSWEELRKALAVTWKRSTDVANWTVAQLFRLDDPLAEKTPDGVVQWDPYTGAS